MKTPTVATKIATNLKIRGLSRKITAGRLSITEATLSNWCRGVILPPIHESIKLLSLLASVKVIDEIPGCKMYNLTLSQIINEKLKLKRDKWEKEIKENYTLLDFSL